MRTLGCSQAEVLSAIGCSEAEYQSWGVTRVGEYSETERRALQSADVVQLLLGINPGLAEWFAGSSGARELFVKGDLNGVVKLDLLARIRANPSSRAYVSSDDSIFNE